MSVCICFTIFTGAAAGGGGGGGGGGAVRVIIESCLGRASVKMRGRRTMIPIAMISRKMAKVVVRPRLVFSLPPDSRRLSSNIRVPPTFKAYVNLDTDCLLFAPESKLHGQRKQPEPLWHQRTVSNQLTNKDLTENHRIRHRAITLPGRRASQWPACPSRSANPDRPRGWEPRSRSTN